MSVNKIVTKVDGTINKTIDFNDLKAGLAAGSHTITVEAFNGATLISTQTRNIAIASSDSTAPTITTAKVEDANPNKLVVVFSEVVTITNTTGLTITGAATPTVSAPTGSGSSTITFTLSTALTNGQSVTLNVASSNTIKDAANNTLAATTKAITNNVAAASSYEAETVSYMNAVAIPDDTTVYYASTPQEITGAALWTSVDTFVASLKANSILTKMKAIYPFIGGTALAHKWNLANPLDTDAAHRLTFFGGMVHDEFGIEGNGSNAYADTNTLHSDFFTLNSESFGAYLGSQDIGSYDIGGVLSSTEGSHYFPAFNSTESVTRSQSETSAGDRPAFVNMSTLGMHLINRANTSVEYRIRKRDQVITFSKTSTSTIALNMLILARNTEGVVGRYASHKMGFSFLAEGLTISEEDAFVIIVNQLQTDLKRNV